MDKSKTIALVVSSILLVAAGAFGIVQMNKYKITKNQLSAQLKNIQKMEDSLNNESDEKSFLSELNIELQEENEMLRDSIEKLHQVIRKLRAELKAKDAIIADLQLKISRLENDYDSRKQEIAILSRRDEVDTDLIAQKELEKSQIKKQMAEYQQEYHTQVSMRNTTDHELSDKMESEDRFRQIVDIVNNTRVEFQNISILNAPTGRPVTRIVGGGKNWKLTNIEFFMNHRDVKALLDEKFMVKIVDIDHQEEIVHTAANSIFPENSKGQSGAAFYYDGNMVELSHINSNSKKGKNYEVQVYYLSNDGEEYLLLDGVKQFIRSGNVVGI